MDGRIVLAAIFGEAFEGGKAIEGEIELHGGAGAAEIVEFGVEIGWKTIGAGQSAGAEGIGVAENCFRPDFAAVFERDAADVVGLNVDSLNRRAGEDLCAGLSGQSR